MQTRIRAGTHTTRETQQDKGPHTVIHEHRQDIGSDLPDLLDWSGELRAFTEGELTEAIGAGHHGKAVGIDRTSHELLKGSCETDGGRLHLLDFYNRILCTSDIPQDWNHALMIVIPKITYPEASGDLRPLAMGGAAAKVFARMLLTRSEEALALRGPEQCSGKGRQTCGFIFSVARIMQLEQEWKVATCWLIDKFNISSFP